MFCYRFIFLFVSFAFVQCTVAQCFMPPIAHPCMAGRQMCAPPPIDTRSDSVDILLYDITAQFLPLSAQTISLAQCDMTFVPIVASVSNIRLDLLGLNVSEVRLDGVVIPFSYTSPLLTIEFSTPLLLGDTSVLTVSYEGQPEQDGSWGGFYFSGQYGFNLGVGFDADPHNYGRVWFPCFDNFIERSAFRFRIWTQPDRPAYCNGHLVSDFIQLDEMRLRIWEIMEPIPTYLACVAMGPYASWVRTFVGEAGQIPVQVAVAPSDSANLTASFTHLADALACFEHWYGPYRWNKIGYSIVPFNGGAMEHATNIAYPHFAVDGTLGYEFLMGHEFAHHWWGDLATCTEAEDMWLNEGWAVYSEHLLREWLYGETSFINAVRDNHLNVLQNAHINEEGYRAVSGLPHQYTYGQHVYNKGASVAHNLRGYLGDSLFRVGIQTCMDANAFDDWSSAGFRDLLSQATNTNLDNFFEDWVFSPGYTHFEIDSMQTQAVSGQFEVTTYIKQKLRGAPHLHHQVPLEVTFVAADQTKVNRMCVVSDEASICSFVLPFAPVMAFANQNQKLNLAHAIEERNVTNTLTNSLARAKCTIKASVNPSDTAFVRAEYHYAFPDTTNCNPYGYQFSNRYWSIDGFWPTDFDATFSVNYDGNGQQDQLDTELFAASANEDSVLLVFRSGAGHPWVEVNDYVHNTFASTTDRIGSLRALHLQRGQYAIVKGITGLVGIQQQAQEIVAQVSPNPTTGNLLISSPEKMDLIQVFATNGQLVQEFLLSNEKFQADISHLPNAVYYFLVFTEKGVAMQKVVKI